MFNKNCVRLGLVLTSVLVSTIVAQRSVPPKGNGAAIKSSGCVRAGVEGGCLILKGFKDKKTYSLHFPDKKPDFDTAISFEGTGGDADTCMQGAVVNVTKWTPLRMKCPPNDKTSNK